MSIYVGRWDCSRCGTQLIEGPKTRCPNCGAPRPEDVQFYLPDESHVVTDAAAIRQAKAGVDWICGHCKAQNKAADKQCKSCGNPRDELSKDVDLQQKSYEQGEVPRAATPSRKKPDYPPARRRKVRPAVTIISFLLLALVLLFASYWPVEVSVEVVGFRWERKVLMEHYEPVDRSAWNLPSGAYNVRKERAIHHYDKVFSHNETYYEDVRVKVGEERYVCGKEDMGNGYFQGSLLHPSHL
jgi:ribosomal protein L37E